MEGVGRMSLQNKATTRYEVTHRYTSKSALAPLTICDQDGDESGNPAWLVVEGIAGFDLDRGRYVSYPMDNVGLGEIAALLVPPCGACVLRVVVSS